MAIRKLTDGAQIRSSRLRGDVTAPLAKPVDTKPAAKPADAKHVETKPVDAKPIAEPTAEQTGARTSFVAAKDDVPVENLVKAAPVKGGKNVLAVRLAATTPKSGGVTLNAEQRLRHLLGKAEAPEPVKAPKPAVLEKLIEKTLGAAAQHLSHLEVAHVLGQPSWASAIAELGTPASRADASHKPNWLLAVHLSKWMENIAYDGASLADVAESFRAARPDVAAQVPHLDSAFVAALQQAYPFMPQWTTSSIARAKTPESWDALFDEGAAVDPMKAHLDAALTSLTEVPLTMKLTGAMADRLVDKAPFAGANVVMVQHMLGQANPLVDAMVRAGMDVSRAEYVGIPYQKNPAVKTTLEQGHGVQVTVPEVGNIDDMWRVITEAIDRAYDRHLQNGEPILVMDDGGYGSKYIAEKYKGKEHLFRVVEQTTRGLTEISKIPEINFPIVDVAGSYGKRFESAQVGDAVKMAVRRVLDAVTTTPTRKDVLIVGAGKVGEGVADSFAGDGARVTIFDPFITQSRQRELEKKGYKVITDKAKALDKKFLVVGCSGHRSIDMNDFAKMSSPVFLASASSKRVEIDTIGLGELAKDKEGQLRRILAAKVNEQETWHYFLKDGRIVTAMADGLPVNFQAVNSIAPELIDHTMSLMLLGAAQAMTSKAKGLDALEPTTQFWLQAQMEGISTEKPTDGSLSFSVKFGGETFHGPRDVWMAIAKSPATPPEVLHEILVTAVGEMQQGHMRRGNWMDPIGLAVLESKHDLPDRTVDWVLDQRIVPLIARVLKNEGTTDAQEDRILDWLDKAFWTVAGDSQRGAPVLKHAPVAVTFSEADGYVMRNPDPYHSTEQHMYYGADRDLVVNQVSAVLFNHPRAPSWVKDAVLHRGAYTFAQDGAASMVQRMKNVAWTTEELDTLFDDCASAAISKARSGKQDDVDYAYDLMEAFRDHPSASVDVCQYANNLMKQIIEIAEESYKRPRLPRGSADWRMSPVGIPLPHYP